MIYLQLARNHTVMGEKWGEKIAKIPITGEKSMTWKARLKIMRNLFGFNCIKLNPLDAVPRNHEKSRVAAIRPAFSVPRGSYFAIQWVQASPGKNFYPVPGGTSRYEAVRLAIFALVGGRQAGANFDRTAKRIMLVFARIHF